MEQSSPSTGLLATMTSITMAVVSISDILLYVQIGAGITAIVSGIIATRYYWLKGNDIKKEK
jgi:hypothetical protein